MQAPLKNKAAIVTGARRGIGRAIAIKLGEMGAAVVVNYVNNSQAATEVVTEISCNGGNAIAIQADMKISGASKHSSIIVLRNSAVWTFCLLLVR